MTRLFLMGGRYGLVLVAALLVWLFIREPFARFAHDYRQPANIVVVSNTNISPNTQQQPHQDSSAGSSPNLISTTNDDDNNGDDTPPIAQQPPQQPAQQQLAEEPPRPKVYKPKPTAAPPIKDHFPWLTRSVKAPEVLENNKPPFPHVPEKTPLLVGFTQNWPMLLQCVSSYIAAGWPAGDIYVIENTGTFRANKQHKLSMQNPFFLNHTSLATLGVNIIAAPTLLTFSQLQNFYLYLAEQRGWEQYFWSHQDVIVFSDEDVKKNDRDHDWDRDPYATIYERAVGLLRYLNGPDMPPWATHFFSYDLFTLVKRDAYLEVGGWDTHIPFKAADCDMYLRLHWAGYWQPQSEAGLVFEVDSILTDIGAFFHIPGAHATFEEDPLFAPLKTLKDDEEPDSAQLQQEIDLKPWVAKHGETWHHLVEVVERMAEAKENSTRYQLTRQAGGAGEPFYRDPEGFEAGIAALTTAGKGVFADKWGHRGCDLLDLDIDDKDAWRVQRDWDASKYSGAEGGNWGKQWMTSPEEENGHG